MSIGRIIVDLLAKTGSFETDINRAAKLSAKRAKEIDESFKRVGKAIGVALVAAAGAAALAFRATTNRLDELSKAAQRAAMPTEDFSRLAYAASLADVSMQDLQTAFGRLARAQADSLKGNNDQSRAFEALGINVKNANGSLRGTKEVFLQFADVFKRNQGSPEIMAIGMQLFGRSFQNLIPLLKDGAAGLKEAGDESDAFGNTLSTKAGQAAEKFNDDLTRLGTQVRGFAQIITTEALEPAGQFTEELVKIGSEALNAKGGIRDLANDGTLKEWAQNGAIVVAVLAESLVFLGKAAHTVAGSISAVWADLEVAAALSRNMFGGFLFESNENALKDALANRNKTVEDANKRLMDLINYDGAKLSNALREQFSAPAAMASFSDARFEANRPTPIKLVLGGDSKSVKSETDKAADAVEKMLAKIQGDIDRFGKSGADKTLRDLWDMAATPDQLNRAEKMLRILGEMKATQDLMAGADATWLKMMTDSGAQAKALEDQAEAWKDMVDPMREFIRNLEKVDEMVDKELISPEMAEGIKAVLAGVKEEVSEMDEFMKNAAENIQSALGSELFDIMDGNFENIGKSFSNMLKRMIAESLAADLTRALFGKSGVGGIIGGIFGLPARADGGPVLGGKSYLVGERGPEIFTPQASGYVLPNGAGGGVTVNQNISVGGGASRSEVAAAMSLAKDSAKREILESMRRGGVFA